MRRHNLANKKEKRNEKTREETQTIKHCYYIIVALKLFGTSRLNH